MPGSSKASTAVSAGSAVATNAESAAAKAAAAAAFHDQIAELTAVSAEATARSMQLRVLTTELTSIKKAADERVQ